MAPYVLKGKRVWVAGHRGMLGSALVRRLASEGCEILTVARASLDLTDQAGVRAWMDSARPDAVFIAAARVGGIWANSAFPAEFIHTNVMIGANIIDGAHRTGVEKLLFVGSSAVYPKAAAQPIVEGALLTDLPDPTHQWYAIAKIAGMKLAEAYRRQHGCNFISALPTNLYGPGDNFDATSSHVMPALIRKAHESKLRGDRQIVVWGTGTPRREFLHVDDCADGCVHLMKTYSDDGPVNLGSGDDVTILDATRIVLEAVGFEGEIVHDLSKPDGVPRRLMSADKIRALGWSPTIALADGVRQTYAWFLENGCGGARDGGAQATARPDR